MIVTFPHLGNAYIAAKALLDGLELEYRIPPLNNKRGLEMGSLHSPEEMCLPYKIMIGNYLQVIEKGANTIILPGSCGPCRFGEYCELQMNLMEELGYDIDMIVIDYSEDIGIKELLKRVNKIWSRSSSSGPNKIKSILTAIRVLNLIDQI